MMSSGPRLRMAPSPTGEPHIGTAYTALFNVLLARRLGGEMILRIEDTDRSRSTPESETELLRSLRWLGLEWSEGPDKGGACGPYRQSERKDIYRNYTRTLLDRGHAFRCYCSPERLDSMRREQKARNEVTAYDGHCLGLSPEEKAAHEKSGTPSVIRMKVPESGNCTFHDGIYGNISIPFNAVDMQVLQKADGMPTYHLANVVDDHLMNITHVGRGEEWLSSTAKHILLYRYFDWTAPAFFHLPLMRGPDRSKLSKRKNPTSLSYFESAGYLPQAMINFLGLFFVTISDGHEIMDLDDLAAIFDPDSPGKGGAVFDMDKLRWINGCWIRDRLSADAYADAFRAWAERNGRLAGALALARDRIKVFGDFAASGAFLFQDEISLGREDFEGITSGPDESLEILQRFHTLTLTLPEWSSSSIHQALSRNAKARGQKLRNIMPALFVAITGSRRALPLFDSMALLGRAAVRQRITRAISVLAGENPGTQTR